MAQWNSWFPAMLYLDDQYKKPLQLYLRQVLIMMDTSSMEVGNDDLMIAETIKYSTIIVATLPILCLYPFLQKYFVKGMMVGALKG